MTYLRLAVCLLAALCTFGAEAVPRLFIIPGGRRPIPLRAGAVDQTITCVMEPPDDRFRLRWVRVNDERVGLIARRGRAVTFTIKKVTIWVAKSTYVCRLERRKTGRLVRRLEVKVKVVFPKLSILPGGRFIALNVGAVNQKITCVMDPPNADYKLRWVRVRGRKTFPLKADLGPANTLVFTIKKVTRFVAKNTYKCLLVHRRTGRVDARKSVRLQAITTTSNPTTPPPTPPPATPQPPTTQPPTTQPPTPQPRTTQPPTTQPPTTPPPTPQPRTTPPPTPQPPTTPPPTPQPPTTPPPTTQPPTTPPPTTQPPTTPSPTPQPPTTPPPTPQPPTTPHPTQQPPTTPPPTTQPPTTPPPTPQPPTTPPPTQQPPTTPPPTQQPPTTLPHTTQPHTTRPPTTKPPTTRHPTTRPPTTPTLTTNAGLTFEALADNYPTYAKYPADALKLKEDMGLPDWLYANGPPNTCAIRMSKAFTDAGHAIDRSKVKNCATQSAGVNGKGNQYIIRALYFQCYLRAICGQPDVINIKSEEDIKGKKGIIIFTGCGFNGCGGQHIDLWDGMDCSLGCDYFDKCTSIELYQLP